MRSHSYNFTTRDILRLVRMPLFVCVAFSVAMFLGASTGVLPPPKPILDTDRTILFHQAEASRRAASAEIILIGDSSCLMDVNARDLERLTGKRVLNLATLSHVSLQTHAHLLRQSLSSNTEPKTIVLLMHPESLRMPSREPYFDRVISTHLKGGSDSVGGDMKLLRVVGADAFRNRLLTRALPIPLTGEYAEHYGFNLNLWEYLDQNNGSALDPHTYPATTPSGNPEYRLAPQLEAAAKLVAADLHLPRTRLVVGITPSPDDYVFRNHAETCRAMLATWAQSLNADASLNALPSILPRTHFASTTHLNQRGVTEYTALLAKALATP